MFKSLRFKNWPIAVKLIAIMILIALLPLAATTYFNANNTSTALRAQIGESFAELATSTADQICRALIENIRSLETMTLSHSVWKELEARNQTYTGTEEAILAQIAELDELWMAAADSNPLIQDTISGDEETNPVAHILHNFKELYPQNVEVFATDRYGALVGSTNRTSDYYQADEKWWQAAWNNGEGGVYVGNPEYEESAGITALNVAVPVRNHKGKVVGVLRTTMDLQPIKDIVTRVKVGQSGHITLVDHMGFIIADPNEERVRTRIPAPMLNLGLPATKGAHWTELLDEDGTPTILGYAKPSYTGGIPAIEDLSWTTLASLEAQEALAPVSASTRVTFLSGAIAILVAAGLAILVTRGLTVQIRQIMRLFGEIGIGNFEARTEVTSGDELGSLATSLNAMLDNTLTLIQTREERDAMQAAVIKMLDQVSGAAEGDLTVEAEVTADVTGAIADSFNFMIAQLREIVSGVQEATLQVSSSAEEIQATAEHLAQGSEAQATQISDTAAAIDEMAVSIQQVSENATQSATVGTQALTNAQQGTRAVENTIEGMNRIRDQVQETAKRIKRLGESSQEIGEVVQLIDDIADRTSILALNASIQAAMAGEAGRGFAVVAEEVERLAERSTDATKQIETLVRTIQNETSEAVTAMEDATREVVEGSMLADQAGQALGEIEAVSNRLAELIQSISLAAKQQARGSETLAKSMDEIAEVTQQTAAGTKQAAASISTLALLADELRASTSTFKLPNGNGHEPAQL
jgi:methyl-accepting chemotaxis protein